MTEAPFQVGLIQMSCRIGDKRWNLAHARERLQSLPDGVRIACLPEFFNTGYHLDLIGDAFFDRWFSSPPLYRWGTNTC